jgi:hypothetical protein
MVKKRFIFWLTLIPFSFLYIFINNYFKDPTINFIALGLIIIPIVVVMDSLSKNETMSNRFVWYLFPIILAIVASLVFLK